MILSDLLLEFAWKFVLENSDVPTIRAALVG